MNITITIEYDQELECAQIYVHHGVYACTDYGFANSAKEAQRIVICAAEEVRNILEQAGMK